MKRMALALLLAVASAGADTVFLKDGRKLEGHVTDKGDSLAVKTKFGTIHVKKEEVDRIVGSPTEEYASRRAALKLTDAEGFFQLALWCRDNNLPQEAQASFAQAIAADPAHEGAHKALGHVRVGERWGSLPELLASVDALITLGKTQKARAFLDPLQETVETQKDAALTSRYWTCRMNVELLDQRPKQAADAADRAAAAATATQRPKARAVAVLIRSSKDGRHNVTADDLVVALGGGSEDLRDPLTPGRHTLADDRVLALALRDVARADIALGKKSLDEGDTLAGSDRARALRCYRAAEALYNGANDMVPGFGRPHQIEAVRRQIPILMSDADECFRGARAASPLDKRYEMTTNAGGRTVFTPKGLADFQDDKRTFNTWFGKLDETFQEILRLQEKFPEEFEKQKEAMTEIRKFFSDRVPAIRQFLNDAERKLK